MINLNELKVTNTEYSLESGFFGVEFENENPQKASINMAAIKFTEHEKSYDDIFLRRLLANALGVNPLDITQIKFDHFAKSDIEFVILKDGKRSCRRRFQGSFEIDNAIFSIDFCKVPLNPIKEATKELFVAGDLSGA